MLILAIETTGPLASVALSDGCKTVQLINHTDYSHLEEIVPMTKSLLDQEGVGPDMLDAVAVSRGPGSFTGVRIGVVTVKGLAQIWNKPVIEVPTLASFAFGDTGAFAGRLLLSPIFDARRNQVYAGAYEPGSDKAVIDDGAYDLEDWLAKLEAKAADYDQIVFFGDGSAAFRQRLDAWPVPHSCAEGEAAYQQAASCARLAARLFERGELKDCYTAEPEYLRAAEAERKLAEKNGTKA